MHSLYLSLGALAVGLVNAWQYPYCDSDNCYRNLVDSRFIGEADTFCVGFLSGTTTAPSAIPTDFNNCNGDVAAVSSACSCITYSLSSTSTSSGPTTVASITPSSPAVITSPTPAYSSSSSIPSEKSTASSAAGVSMTTSTIYTTKVYTVTSCAATVTNCPAKIGHVTTETIVLSTTVCPVSPAPVASTATLYTTKTYTITSCPATVTNCPVGSVSTTVYPITTSIRVVSSAAGLTTLTSAGPKTSVVGTGSGSPSKTSPGTLQVTAAAGRISSGFEMAVAAAGVVVAFL